MENAEPEQAQSAERVDVVRSAVRRARERAQGLTEYCVIVMIMAILLILSVQVIGHQTTGMYSNVGNAFPH